MVVDVVEGLVIAGGGGEWPEAVAVAVVSPLRSATDASGKEWRGMGSDAPTYLLLLLLLLLAQVTCMSNNNIIKIIPRPSISANITNICS